MRSEVVSRDPVFLANGSGVLLGEVQANLSDDRLRKVERPLRYLSQVRLLALLCGFSLQRFMDRLLEDQRYFFLLSTCRFSGLPSVDLWLRNIREYYLVR
ncbi:hypothetical protein NPIL_213761 [Nephila pilipes]|uniref:Uncharacterized protein n=1 Tax=Nephila pilipes TaxID=299642 RepID=A0A8X6P4Z6_NEPPI|nr:hypothetical protein NPIL_213761 [Nephila pilipes]